MYPFTARLGGVAALAVCLSSPAWAQGFTREQPLPFSIKDSLTAIERGFRPKTPPPLTMFPDVRETQPDSMPAFFRDSHIEFNARSYYRDDVKITTSPTVSEAWAGGGSATLTTGRLFDLISGGVTVYTSQPLYAPAQYGNTGLLLPNQQGYTVVGELYGQVHLPADNVFTAGRSIYDTPFIGPQDNRMTPNTFYGYTLTGKAGDPEKGPAVNYGGGYIATMKPRDSDVFLSMSRAAGGDFDRGVGVAGGLLTWGPLSAGAIEYYSQDTINIAYGEGKFGWTMPGDISGLLALQYADQRSTGSNLLTGSYFSTDQFGARLQLGYSTAILTVAYSVVDPSYQMQSPWNSNPFYTDAQILTYERAGENAFMAGLSYNMTPIGLKGLAAAVQFFNGWTNAVAAGKPLVESEWDFALEWRPDFKPLSGLWLQARYGTSQTYQDNRITAENEVRLILNYTVKLY